MLHRLLLLDYIGHEYLFVFLEVNKSIINRIVMRGTIEAESIENMAKRNFLFYAETIT